MPATRSIRRASFDERGTLGLGRTKRNRSNEKASSRVATAIISSVGRQRSDDMCQWLVVGSARGGGVLLSGCHWRRVPAQRFEAYGAQDVPQHHKE
jgi:hypothetical protein